MASASEIIDQAMALSPAERLEIARRIFESVENEPADDLTELDEYWNKEIDARIDRIESGESKLIDWKVAMENARKAIKGL